LAPDRAHLLARGIGITSLVPRATAYRTAFGVPRATLGRQPTDLAGAQLWVVPNPSGRNAHASLDALAAAYREAALAAGVPLGDDMRAP